MLRMLSLKHPSFGSFTWGGEHNSVLAARLRQSGHPAYQSYNGIVISKMVIGIWPSKLDLAVWSRFDGQWALWLPPHRVTHVQEDLDVVAFAYTPVPYTVNSFLSSFNKHPDYLIHTSQSSGKGRSRGAVLGPASSLPKQPAGETAWTLCFYALRKTVMTASCLGMTVPTSMSDCRSCA